MPGGDVRIQYRTSGMAHILSSWKATCVGSLLSAKEGVMSFYDLYFKPPFEGAHVPGEDCAEGTYVRI